MVVGKKKYLLLILCVVVSGLVIVSSLPSSYGLFKINKEVTGSITVPENNYCINNGFNKLSDCILVMENYATSIDDAKKYIEAKKVESFREIAPKVTYEEVINERTNPNGVISTSNHFSLAKTFTFDSKAGMFKLNNYVDDNLSDKYIDYYTCGGTNTSYTGCSTIYQIKSYRTDTSGDGDKIQRITSAIVHTFNTVDALDSEIGLYVAPDNFGASYYYRGNVKNNYVNFAGFTWRIVRENGNGSIRMIYSGTTPSATGAATFIKSSAYNIRDYDPAYLGYMYSENFELNTSKNSTTNYTNFNEGQKYYFGSSYTFDDKNKKFILTGDVIDGTWEDVHDNVIKSYPYTCFEINPSDYCNVLFNITGYENSYTAVVKPFSYTSVDYDSTLKNVTDSTIKTVIDDWYSVNILNKKDNNGMSYSNYLNDEIFCNDRSIYQGSGYLLSPNTRYGSYNRVNTTKNPSLICPQSSDKFTVSTNKGNGSLIYPIGLLTADEGMMAGGVYGSNNTKYYLYTGQSYWTMSPSRFSSPEIQANVWYLNNNGLLKPEIVVSRSYGVRPVINLSKDVLITGGDGTASNPYTVTLEK